ncbi:MAG: ATPase, partial [Chloroflexi bacterium]
MSNMQTLRQILHRIDGRSYPAYKDIRGSYRFSDFTLFVDHVQGDPFAAPSRLRVCVPLVEGGFLFATRSSKIRQIALRDFLARMFSAACRTATDRRGSGKSGLLRMDAPGQEILERSAIVVTDKFVEARFTA